MVIQRTVPFASVRGPSTVRAARSKRTTSALPDPPHTVPMDRLLNRELVLRVLRDHAFELDHLVQRLPCEPLKVPQSRLLASFGWADAVVKGDAVDGAAAAEGSEGSKRTRDDGSSLVDTSDLLRFWAAILMTLRLTLEGSSTTKVDAHDLGWIAHALSAEEQRLMEWAHGRTLAPHEQRRFLRDWLHAYEKAILKYLHLLRCNNKDETDARSIKNAVLSMTPATIEALGVRAWLTRFDETN